MGSPSPSACTASSNGSIETFSVPVGVEPGGSRSLVRLKSRLHGAAMQSCWAAAGLGGVDGVRGTVLVGFDVTGFALSEKR